ncbi:MAG TPA: hypothetical protein VIJ85_09265 [Rhizomicrobium sp.]
MRYRFLFLALLAFAPLSAAAASPAANGSPAQTDVTAGMVSVTASADTATPYQNQAVLYTVRVVVRANISSTSLSDVSVANAIVEARGEPDVSDQIEHGMPARVAEFHYIITPLQPGKMTIPAIVLHGEFRAPNISALADPSGSFAFSHGTQQSLNFFSTYGAEPFSIVSNAVTLNVKPPAAAMDPWLPLTSLTISEATGPSPSVHVGEPLTRKITLSAKGAVGSQLPDVQAQQENGNFRAYADRPTMGENVDKKTGAISGWRTDSYSVIAQSAGRLVLPAIKISWWDVVNNRAATAQLPERIVNILPATAALTPPAHDASTTDRKQTGKPAQLWRRLQNFLISRAFIFGFLSVVIAALLFGAWLQMKDNIRPTWEALSAFLMVKHRPQNPALNTSPEGKLRHVRTAAELNIFLQAYAHRQWGTPKTASLEKIFSMSQGSRTPRESDDIAVVTKETGAALYANKTVDVEDLKKRSRRILRSLRNSSTRDRKSREKLSRLNPT